MMYAEQQYRMTEAEQPKQPRRKRARIVGFGALVILSIGFMAVAVYAQTSSTIRRNVYIDSVSVGGMTREAAADAVAASLASKDDPSVLLSIEGQHYPIPAQNIDLDHAIPEALERAWKVGRSGNLFLTIADLSRLPFTTIPIPLDYQFNGERLLAEVANIASLVDQPLKDLRLAIEEDIVVVHTDTKPGHKLDQAKAFAAVTNAIYTKTFKTENLTLAEQQPSVSLASAHEAQRIASQALLGSIHLANESQRFSIKPGELAVWMQSRPNGERLEVSFDDAAIAAYVTTVAKALDAEPQSPKVTVAEGKVTDFVAPRTGKELDQSKTVSDITAVLAQRMASSAPVAATADTDVPLTISVKKPDITDESAAELGITELIGSASTRFTGSPPNRISNIKNGVKFLSGKLIAPNEEFSTLTALGTIDNTTGYLPELVIKENRTIPEYGGGLCQVSTTLFRATMNTGLPISARRNHSYRVSYYEKDGEGNFIGPGLDATIYNPAPDFKFVNDTNSYVLIQGRVEGDKITFDFYGTKDGRKSSIDGPHTLSTSPAGEDIVTETDTLKPGEKKQIERPHAGGTAVATYTITYADGRNVTSEYKSFYRNWPAQYLVGVAPIAETPASVQPESENPVQVTPTS